MYKQALASLAFLSVTAGAFAQMQVVSTTPRLNATGVSTGAAISVTFDRAVDPATLVAPNFGAFARWSGPVVGPLTLSNGNRTVTLTPTRPLAAGEMVMLVMSRNLRGADGVALRSAGYTVTFMTAVRPSTRFFRQQAVVSNRDASGAQTRLYGGLACDLNLDGWADLTTINEVSSDARVMLNRGDGSGLFGPLLTPYSPIALESSPNEPADFNGDGFVDIVTSAAAEAKLTVLFGNGDGTFDPPLYINVGGYPRGFGILDADGDGDMDITCAQANSNNIVFLRNNGNGTFAAPTFFEGGVNAEYGMTAAEMNNDGIMDLVVAGEASRTINVLRGNGNGTFTQISSRNAGGAPWVLVAGDVNGDGNMDISAGNAATSNGCMMFGDGNGALGAPIVKSLPASVVSTDLADLDGDGDLDWILASFGAAIWRMYRNDGGGTFTLEREWQAPGNASCALPADFDNDGDVDLALIDEIADVIVMMKNACVGDYDLNNAVDGDDVIAFFEAWDANDTGADLTQDGGTDGDDVIFFFSRWDQNC
ncbi:MAG: FG-GAP-like repeat-containing protein [Phycisphaerales bacterium]